MRQELESLPAGHPASPRRFGRAGEVPVTLDASMRGYALLSRALLGLARSRWSRRLLGWIMTHASFALPVDRVRETETLLAFHHPRPSHAIHILLVPKAPFASLLDVPSDADDVLRDLLETAQLLVREYGLEDRGYRLIVNGGAYQDVPHLHVHLVAD